MRSRASFILIFTCSVLMMAVSSAHAQQSILAVLLIEQDALVAVEAGNIDLFKSKPAIAGIDRATGRFLITRRLSKAELQRSGAGVIIDPHGIIVTNGHVVERAETVNVILADHKEIPARVVYFISNLDLALLEIDPPYPLKTVRLADSDKVKLGDDIFSIGNSFLLDNTVSGGKVIGLGSHRSRSNPGKTTDMIQTTVNLYSGDSGGPLFDRQGHLVGLMTAKEKSSDRSSFAIPSNKIAEHLIDYLDKKSKIQHHGP